MEANSASNHLQATTLASQSPVSGECYASEAEYSHRQVQVVDSQGRLLPNKVLNQSGYTQRHSELTSIPGRFLVHRWGKVDQRDIRKNFPAFSRLVDQLAQELNITRTEIQENIISATAFIPYLRKIDRTTNVSDNPSEIQLALLSELILRIRQQFTVDILCQLLKNGSDLAGINIDSEQATISINQHSFHRDDLGNDQFRELCDRLKKCQGQPHLLQKMTAGVHRRGERRVSYYYDVINKIMSVQSASIRERLASAFAIDNKNSLLPKSVAECNQLIQLIPNIQFATHPGFAVMKPLVSKLVKDKFEGGGLTSRALTRLRSSAQYNLLTTIPTGPTLRESDLHLNLVKESLLDPEKDNGINQLMAQKIEAASPEELREAVELFDRLLCDLTPSVSKEMRLGIIYTMNKFKHRKLLEQLLLTSGFGARVDPFLTLYTNQLSLTYALALSTSEVPEFEAKTNVIIKTLLLRMALCTTLIARKEGITVKPEVLTRAQRLIAHHNEVVLEIKSEQADYLSMMHDMDVDPMDDPTYTTEISNNDYLKLPQNLSSEDTIQINPEQLILPVDKQFKAVIKSLQGGHRREARAKRDESRQLNDFVLTSMFADLAAPMSQLTKELPVGYLFSGENNICHRQPKLITDLMQLNAVLPAGSRHDEQQLMETVSQLFILANKTGRPAVKIVQELLQISQKSAPALAPLILRLSESIHELPANRDRRDAIEYLAFLLIYEFDARQCSLKHLVKLIYIIQSRAESLQFGGAEFDNGCDFTANSDDNKIKHLLLGQYFVAHWHQPDGLQGQRIRTILKKAFTSYQGGGYEEIIESLLKSMRPSHVEESSYPAIIDSLCYQVENLLSQKNVINDLSEEQAIFRISTSMSSTYEGMITPLVKSLAESISSLLDQLMENGNAVHKTGSMIIDSRESEAACGSDQPLVYPVLCKPQSDRKREFFRAFPHDRGDHAQKKFLASKGTGSNAEAYNYLGKHALRLAESFIVWARKNHNDSNIGLETSLQKMERIIKVLPSLCAQSFNRSVMLPVTQQIVQINEKLKYTQRLHAAWLSRIHVYETNDRSRVIQSMMDTLESIPDLPEPEELQQSITQYITPVSNNSLSNKEREAVATIEALNVQPEKLLEALHHPLINVYAQQPELLLKQIELRQEIWDEPTLARYKEYQYLRDRLHGQRKELILTNPAQVKMEKISCAHGSHSYALAMYRKKQQVYQSHWLHNQQYPNGLQRFKKLQEIPTIHTIQSSGISRKPLSERQKVQLNAVFNQSHATAKDVSGNTLFDLINADPDREKNATTTKPVKPSQQAEIITCYERGCFSGNSVSIKSFDEEQKAQIGRQAGYMQQINEEYSLMKKDLENKRDTIKRLTMSIEKRLGSKKDEMIEIDGKKYQYLDALIAFYHEENDSFCRPKNRLQIEIMELINARAYENRLTEYKKREDRFALRIAARCDEKGVPPHILPDFCKFMEFESLMYINDIEQVIAETEQAINENHKQKSQNLSEISKELKQLEEEHEQVLAPVREYTDHLQTELFEKAFESNQQLTLTRSIQSILCDHMVKGGGRIKQEDPLISDCLNLLNLDLNHPPDIIELPIDKQLHDSKLAVNSLIFTLLSCKGTQSLLEPLFSRRLISPYSLIARTFEPSSGTVHVKGNALILSAAKGHYQSCAALIGILKKSFSSSVIVINLLQMLLTESPVADGRNLLHHVVKPAQAEIFEALLELINVASGTQQYDPDYPVEDLQNQVALDKGLLLKELLTQTDYEGLLPSDLLLFNIGRTIRKWPQQNEKSLNGYYEKFLINDSKGMWKLAAESLSVEQLHKTIECFMKGIQDLSQLSPAKQQAAEDFLQKLVRIFRVHGPGELHDQLMSQVAPVVAEDETMDLD